MKDDNVSTPPQSVDDPSSPSTSDDPNLSTIHVVPSTPTTIHDDDDDKNDQASTTIINDDDTPTRLLEQVPLRPRMLTKAEDPSSHLCPPSPPPQMLRKNA